MAAAAKAAAGLAKAAAAAEALVDWVAEAVEGLAPLTCRRAARVGRLYYEA